jgi:hypothetical protein
MFHKVPCVKGLVPLVAILGGDGIFKRCCLVGGLEVIESMTLMNIRDPRPLFTFFCYEAMR